MKAIKKFILTIAVLAMAFSAGTAVYAGTGSAGTALYSLPGTDLVGSGTSPVRDPQQEENITGQETDDAQAGSPDSDAQDASSGKGWT